MESGIIATVLSALSLAIVLYNALVGGKRSKHQNNLDDSNALLNQQKLITELQKENQEMRVKQFDLDEKYKNILKGIIDLTIQIQLFGNAEITSQKWRNLEDNEANKVV